MHQWMLILELRVHGDLLEEITLPLRHHVSDLLVLLELGGRGARGLAHVHAAAEAVLCVAVAAVAVALQRTHVLRLTHSLWHLRLAAHSRV